VLGYGCVQEEIRFVINTELIVGLLFCESMRKEEAIIIHGTEKFNKYTGYAQSFKWNGSYEDTTPVDEYNRKQTHIVAIDALCYHKPYLQFEEFALKREICKANVGFYHDFENVPIPLSTGICL
jgi:poly(ADP-ribose) glycohydrolase